MLEIRKHTNVQASPSRNTGVKLENEVGSAGRAVLSLKTCSGSFLFVLFVPAAGNLPKYNTSFIAEPFISYGQMRCSIAHGLIFL
jgi:hypothetical protein